MEPWREPRKEPESSGNVSLILESDDELEEEARRTAAILNED